MPDVIAYWISNLFWAGIGAVIGTLIALELEAYREPRLVISAGEFANDDITYPPGHSRAAQRWKYFRVAVLNRDVPKAFRWVVKRGTAQRVEARLTFVQLKRSMKGRWAGTLELPQSSPLDYLRLANFPDPVTITAGRQEILDVFVKPANDVAAYGWNNEGYLFNWKAPQYRLAPGDYRIDIEVTSVEGSSAIQSFRAHIDATVDNTSLAEWK